MAKSYSVSPSLRNGTTFYIAVFKDSTGKRVCRGLGTDNRDDARLICDGLVALHNRGIRSITEKPIDVCEQAARLYFGEKKANETEAKASNISAAMSAIQQQLEAFPKSVRATMLPVLLERESLQNKLRDVTFELAATKRELKTERENREALERSMLGQAAKAGKGIPPLDKALEMFLAHMQSETTAFNAKVVHAIAKKFVESLPAERKTLADVTHGDVASFIEADVAKGDQHKKASRRDALRRRLGRFLNWSAKRWGYVSQIGAVRAVTKDELDRERGGIHYHTASEINAAIEKLPSNYWKTLVATLGYAGLQLAELCWLRVSDVHIAADGKSGYLHVTTVEDGDEKHLLKTSHRKRKVNLHPTLLLPKLKEHLKDGAGKTYVFPVPGAEGTDFERWTSGGLSTALRGHKGGKRRKPTPALLPKGMNAKSLRRSFGSLLLRKVKNYADVAAAMGNTPEVVKMHYGEIRGHEVSVDF
ncbi:MAG TPA: hypothetical protein VEK08_18650 [Planctomycetota bacterium]|nr:hypothetical protein [Planctomycetota bacterium]